jgi:hypothetical protein
LSAVPAALAPPLPEGASSVSSVEPRQLGLQRFLEAAVLAFGASAGEITLRAGERERAFRAAGAPDAGTRRSEDELDRPPTPLRASAAAGNFHAEVSLAGGDWSRGADSLAPAFAGVLGELAPISR